MKTAEILMEVRHNNRYRIVRFEHALPDLSDNAIDELLDRLAKESVNALPKNHEEIISKFCSITGVSLALLRTTGRSGVVVKHRTLLSYILLNYTILSPSDIANKILGGVVGRSNLHNNIKSFIDSMSVSVELRNEVDELINKMGIGDYKITRSFKTQNK